MEEKVFIEQWGGGNLNIKHQTSIVGLSKRFLSSYSPGEGLLKPNFLRNKFITFGFVFQFSP